MKDAMRSLFRAKHINANMFIKNFSGQCQWHQYNGEGNQSTQRKPPTCHKSLTNFIT